MIRAVQHCSRNATREETQAEEFNGKEEFTDEDDEDEDLDDEEDDDDGDDQFPPLKELEDLNEDRELIIVVAAAASSCLEMETFKLVLLFISLWRLLGFFEHPLSL